MDAALLARTDDLALFDNDGPLAVYGERLAVARASRAKVLEADNVRLTLDLVRLRARAKGGR